MSAINDSPDSLSLSGNLKKFVISSDSEITFALSWGDGAILDEKYQPGADGLATIDVQAIIDRLLGVDVPTSGTITTQGGGVGDFTATIDGAAYEFRVVKGGVAELSETAESWLAEHFLSWQPQEKLVLQTQPEWLGIYPTAGGSIIVALYFADGSSTDYTLATLTAGSLYTIDVSWAAINDGAQPIAWDVWFEAGGTRTTPVQRYQLRNATGEEHGFVWANTLGGIDSVSFTGAQEDDEKLEHKDAVYYDDSVSEYDADKAREIRQSTGYVTEEEGIWLKDFFYSPKKYLLRPDGSLRQIAVVSSKVVSVSSDDEHAYEFNFRMGTDSQLLNLDRTYTELPAPEGLADFFLTDLLSGLTEASYAANLILAVQSPFAVGWQKLSLAQLWGGALPELVDGTTIRIVDGKLTVIGIGTVATEVVEFTDTNTPAIEDWPGGYAASFGQYPSVTVQVTDESGNRIERQERPTFEITEGLISRITFDLMPPDDGGTHSGIIIIK
ncbi:MAG: hypothetical protein ACOYMF_05620 [Bacteroidales bacterium]